MAQVDIRSYGARCDGSDDSGAVQAAINAAGSGGTVVVSCSAGIGSAGIVLADKSNVTVMGSGSGAGFRALSQTGLGVGGFGPVLFAIKNCTNCTIKDLVIDSRNIAVVGAGFERCSGSTLQNVSVSNVGYPANAGIVASGGNGNRYIGNTVWNTAKTSSDGTRGMWIGNGGSQTEQNATIANNTISDVGATGIATHINNSVIRDNLVTNAYGAGIKVTPTSGLGGQTTVEGNTVRGNLFHGIQISKADSPVIIQRNTIDANKIAGIYASDGAFYGRISGNTITNNPEAGIYIYNGDGLAIDGNQISGNGHGVLIEAVSGYTLRGLQITSNTISTQQAHGVTMWGRGGVVDTVNLSSNSIYNGSIYGVFIEQNSGNLTGISASGNCFSNNVAGTIYDNRGMLAPPPSSGNCSTPGVTADKTAPSVSITAPANGATVSGTIAVTANASDNVGVAGVQFLLNGSAFGPKLTSAPFTVQWDTRSVKNGSYQWNAVATDAAGNSTTSATAFANVNNADTTAPTVSILTPANGATVSGAVSVTSSASDNIGVASVQYTLNGSPLGTALSVAPYAYSWNTAGLAAGNYTLTATARDAAGNQSASSVAVKIADTVAPTVRITAPAAGATVSGTISLAAAASDNVGVAGVQFLVDGANFGAESTSGYTVSLNTTSLANGAHVISAIARDAAGNRATAASVSVTVSNAAPAPAPAPTPTTTVVARINAGGRAYTDPQGNAWAADTGYNGGDTWDAGVAVTGTTNPAVYQTQRWAEGPLVYTFAVQNGTYTVNLKWAETYVRAAGQRLFHININGTRVASSFDIYAAAGGFAKAVDRSYTVNVTTGQVRIEMISTMQNPTVSGIEILKSTTTPPPPTVTKPIIRVNAGSGAYTDALGNVWAADNSYNGGDIWTPNYAVSGTTAPGVYQTQRWAEGSLIYTFAVPNAAYTVNLKFAELYVRAAGQRIFHINVNGQRLLSNFDIYAASGGFAKAVDRAFTVNVTGGKIAVEMIGAVQNPTISGIEIY